MEVDRNNLYDHIDTSHKTLVERIETLDKRTTQQIHSIDKLTKERLDSERHDREDYVHSCLRKDRLEEQENCEHKHTDMKHELKGYLDSRFTNFERYYGIVANKQDPCYWCYGNEHHNQPRYHDDDMLNQNNMVYDPTEPPMPGRLYKSKSDETLSVASSHPSRRHWKLRTNVMENVVDMKLAYANSRARRQEKKMRSKSAGVSARAVSIEQLSRIRDGSLPPQWPSRIPEGDSGSNLHSEYKTYQEYVAKQHQWKTKRNPVGAGILDNFQRPEPQHSNKYNSLRRACSQQVTVEVHQTERPRSASNGGTQPQMRDISKGDPSRMRSSGDYTRTRCSSVSRAPDGSVCGQSSSQRHLPQSQSAYSVMTNGQNKQGSTQSTSYDGCSVQRQQQAEHQRYAEHADSRVVNTQVCIGPEPPTRTSSQLASQYIKPHQVMQQQPLTTTPSSTSLRWNPIHTSSPDTPLSMFGSPNNSDSLISSQKSSPLYPSPNCPKGTRSESSSNPDSGYGSRLLGGRQVSGPTLPGSTSSSFQSHEHNSSVSTNHSSLNETSPLTSYNRDGVRHQQNTFTDGQLSTMSRLTKIQPQCEQQQQFNQQQYQQQQQHYPPQQIQQPRFQEYRLHQQPKQYQQPQQRQSIQQHQHFSCDQKQQRQQPQQQQQQPRIVNHWHQSKTSPSDSQPMPSTSTRMWPPIPRSWSVGGTSNHKDSNQSEHNSQSGIIGKATQV